MVPKECGFNKVHRIRESPSFIPAPVNLGSNLAGGGAIGGNRTTTARTRRRPYASFFLGVRIRLGTILGRFSIIYFRGLGLRIRVRVWVSVMVRCGVMVRVSLGLGSELGLGFGLGL